MKVCKFEPPLGCQARSRAELSTSCFLFDRAIRFMIRLTPTIGWNRYEMRKRTPRRSICKWYAAAHTMPPLVVNLAPRLGCQCRDFFVRLPWRSICSAFRNYLLNLPEPARQGNNEFLVIPAREQRVPCNTGKGTTSNTGKGTTSNTGKGTTSNTGKGTTSNTGKGTGQGNNELLVIIRNKICINMRGPTWGSKASCYDYKEKALEGGNRDEAGASK
jgi:hypothetical protein